MIDSISSKLNKLDDSFVIDLLITMLMIAIFYIILFPIPRVDNLTYSLTDDIQRALVNPNLITQRNYDQIFTRYLKSRDVTFRTEFLSSGAPKIPEISSFGIALLAKYADNESKKNYLLVAEHLITSLDSIFQKSTPQDLISAWKPNWRVTIPLTRMFATYMYLGHASSILKICHLRITQITPELSKSVDQTRTGADLAYVAIPRLMSNYLSDRDTFIQEVRTDVFNSLDSVFNVTRNVTEEVKDGVYPDGSTIVKNVATFKDLVTLDFYAKIYDALGRRSNIGTLVTSLLDDVLHPQLDFLPFGLFGGAGDVSGTELLATFPKYNRTATVGVRIFPFIGLGVFKAPKFVFSLRVQRPNIAAYQSDPSGAQFALGWIQMRKMFVKGQTYSDVWDSKRLKTQPGVMMINYEDTKIEGALYAKQDAACLGHLDDVRLMFWINKYSFPALLGDLKVAEFGVCTDNGLALCYIIDNVTSPVRVQVRDPDLGELVMKQTLGSNQVWVKGATDKNFQWRQVFDEDLEPQRINVGTDLRSMAFRFNNDTWEVKLQDEKYFLVLRGKKIVMAGSSSGNVNDTFVINEQTYQRNSRSLMYKPIE